MKNTILSLIAVVFAISASNVVLADNHEGMEQPAATTDAATQGKEVAKKAKAKKAEKKAKKEHKEETHGTDAHHQ